MSPASDVALLKFVQKVQYLPAGRQEFKMFKTVHQSTTTNNKQRQTPNTKQNNKQA